jgi:hypothetical protein
MTRQPYLIVEVPKSHSVRLLWTSDRPVAETLATYNTHNTHVLGGIRTRNPNKGGATEPRIKPRGHWDRHIQTDMAVIQGWLGRSEINKLN